MSKGKNYVEERENVTTWEWHAWRKGRGEVGALHWPSVAAAVLPPVIAESVISSVIPSELSVSSSSSIPVVSVSVVVVIIVVVIVLIAEVVVAANIL
jgi:hypothetical protein